MKSILCKQNEKIRLQLKSLEYRDMLLKYISLIYFFDISYAFKHIVTYNLGSYSNINPHNIVSTSIGARKQSILHFRHNFSFEILKDLLEL